MISQSTTMGNCLSCFGKLFSRLPNNYDDGQCAICLQPHKTKSQPKCGHVFCFQCLVDWSKIKRECPTCKQPFAKFRHQVIGSPETGKYDQKYRLGPPAQRPYLDNDGTLTIDDLVLENVVTNENLVPNNVAQAQALYDLLGIFIAEVERVRAGESRPGFTPDNVRLLPAMYRCRRNYRLMLRMN